MHNDDEEVVVDLKQGRIDWEEVRLRRWKEEEVAEME
jgi:hypothetical protein